MAPTHKGTFTVTSNSALLPSTQTDYTLLVSVTNNVLKSVANGGAVQEPDGDDIHFFSDSGLTSLLFYELVRWDASSGLLEAWVKIPSLALGTVFYAGIGGYGPGYQGGAQGTNLDSSWRDQLHLDTDAVNGFMHESTSNDDSGTNTNFTAATGQINGGASSDGTSGNKITLGDGNSIPSGSFSVSAWIKTAGTADTYEMIFVQGLVGGGGGFIFLGVNTAGKLVWSIDAANVDESDNAVDDDQWHHVIGTVSGTTLTMYIDGAQAATPTTRTPNYTNGYNVIGGYFLNGGGDAFPWIGTLDEVSVHNAARSADWIKIAYTSQLDNATFLAKTFEAISAGGPSKTFVNRSNLIWR